MAKILAFPKRPPLTPEQQQTIDWMRAGESPPFRLLLVYCKCLDSELDWVVGEGEQPICLVCKKPMPILRVLYP